MRGTGGGRRSGATSLAVAGAALAAAVATSLVFHADDDPLAGIWLGNAVQLAVLLVVPRRRWPAFLATFAAVQVALVTGTGASWPLAVTTTFANGAEVLVAALAGARDPDWVEGRSDRVGSWVRFALWIVVAAPLVGAALGTPVTAATTDMPWTAEALWDTARTWYVADALALAVVVPLILRLRPSRLPTWRDRREVAASGGLVALVAAVALVVFSTSTFLLLFAVPLPLVLLLFRTGFPGLAAGMAVVTTIALVSTRDGRGPFDALAGGATGTALLTCQVFLISVFATLVVIAALLDERQRLAALEAADLEIYRLVARSSGDLVFITEADGWVRYLSPDAGSVLDLPEGALMGHGWAAVMHPDDIEPIERVLAAVARGEPQEYTCRMRRGDGEWRWFEARARRSEGDGPTGAHLVVGTFRDVTDRRRREEGLRARTAELAALARTDPLTGLPNRRELAARRAAAWREAARHGRSLALLVVDVDRFKAYNDGNGHLAGDRCLARIGAALAGATGRPGDVCGRYGGEEFVVVLPDTDLRGAGQVAEKLRAAVEALAVPHAPAEHGVVTVSIGAASCRPTGGAPAPDDDALFEAADAALFRAKRGGRNRVVALAARDGGVRRLAAASGNPLGFAAGRP